MEPGFQVTVETARYGIDFIERQRLQQGLTQVQISDGAGEDDGKALRYYRMKRRGDIMLSAFIRYARAAGYNVVLTRKEHHEEQSI